MQLRLLGQVNLETSSSLIDLDSKTVEIHISHRGDVIWINGHDGYTILRVSKIKNLILTDDREGQETGYDETMD